MPQGDRSVVFLLAVGTTTSKIPLGSDRLVFVINRFNYLIDTKFYAYVCD